MKPAIWIILALFAVVALVLYWVNRQKDRYLTNRRTYHWDVARYPGDIKELPKEKMDVFLDLKNDEHVKNMFEKFKNNELHAVLGSTWLYAPHPTALAEFETELWNYMGSKAQELYRVKTGSAVAQPRDITLYRPTGEESYRQQAIYWYGPLTAGSEGKVPMLAAGGIYITPIWAVSEVLSVVMDLPLELNSYLHTKGKQLHQMDRVRVISPKDGPGPTMRLREVRHHSTRDDNVVLAWPIRSMSEEIVQEFIKTHAMAKRLAIHPDDVSYHFYQAAGHYHIELCTPKCTILFSDRTSYYNATQDCEDGGTIIRLGESLLYDGASPGVSGKYEIQLEKDHTVIWYLNTDLAIKPL